MTDSEMILERTAREVAIEMRPLRLRPEVAVAIFANVVATTLKLDAARVTPFLVAKYLATFADALCTWPN